MSVLAEPFIFFEKRVRMVILVKGPIKNVTHEEMAIAIKVMKPEKAAGPSKVCAEMISASGQVGVSVMVELRQRVLDGKECQMNGKQMCWYQFSREKKM